MVNIPLNEILLLLTTYGYVIVFPISIVEGPIISVFSGFLVWGNIFNAYIAFGVLLFGDLVGDSIYYFIGRYGGRKLISKVGHYVGATEKRVENLEKHFKKHDWKILLFGKTQAIGAVILLISGVVRVPYLRFIFYNLIGSIPKIILLMFIGYYFGKAYIMIDTYMGYFALLWFLFAVSLFLIYFYINKYIQEKSFKNI